MDLWHAICEMEKYMFELIIQSEVLNIIFDN